MRSWKVLALAMVACQLGLWTPTADAGAKIELDETRFVTLGAGARASLAFREDSAPSGDDWSNDFNVDNARIYIGGQIHEYVKFEFNTECVFCGNSSLEEFVLLDAIAKFELSPYFNVWAGRLIAPAERRELNGPFYSNTYDAYRTPLFSSDFSVDFGAGGAGVYARDHGVNVWGAAGPGGALQYVFGVFAGIQDGPNQDDNPLFAGRVAYNFLEVENNPGYYTSGTYYGGGGDILTLGVAAQYQADGTGSAQNPGDFFGVAVDLLGEFVLSDESVATIDLEFKSFDADHPATAAADADPNKFLMFSGESYSVAALYLLPGEVGIGRLQPYLRYTGVEPDEGSSSSEIEGGLNYIISGHNARVSAFYQYGDLNFPTFNTAPGADEQSTFRIAVQLQI